MVSEYSRRFSLDKVEIDPEIKNRIMSIDGDEHAGDWDGEDIDVLVKELDRIEESVDANYAGLPHNSNIPEDLRNQVEKDYPIWACDLKGQCLIGENANKIHSVDKIRKHYEDKYGGVAEFKEKLRIDRKKFEENLRLKQ